MANFNIDGKSQQTFDAIVIGSGISGGWAAKEFTGKGLRTLVLERGRDVKHLKDYPTTNMYPYEFPHRGALTEEIKAENPVASRCYAFREDAMHFFVKDKEHPYVQEKPFDWIRGYQVGGKSLLWARQTQRWSDFDFEGPARDDFAVDWPIRYKDLEHWYSYVERFAGIAGNRDGLAELPDGEFLPGFPLNAVEDHFRKVIHSKYTSRKVISARCAHLSQPQAVHLEQGRGKCQNRVLCQRGCPFGGYFSSNAATLPWAEKTGKLTLRPDAIVESIIYDEQQARATGVRVIDAKTKKVTEYFARVIFVNAAALNTNLILLNSTSSRFPQGLGNDSGVLGKYVAFHNYSARIYAEFDGLNQFKTDGRNPAGGGYMPRFRNLLRQETDFKRGYAAGFSAYRGFEPDMSGIGTSLKKNITENNLGPWRVNSHMMGETIPKESNYVRLSRDKKDAWGIPQLQISVSYDDNDAKMKADYLEQLEEMFTVAGFKNIRRDDASQAPGLDIHEMGGARMGHDPQTSVLNKWNQVHACKNVFVTDGACMTSTSTQNPSLTYMALTARAVDYAVAEMKRSNI
ncbi:GMC family oxidoreductase [Pedobacter yulinensis]|uniref:GMC family oxidoreductase n=1 Tax=Pedobacter yulinensis TaxID=2126353 RepID=A0A2T3HJJ6_9SPHI|nr:GMC family oxidoreductase [Pedobacter yulinensis]PST82612.1 GMC family oxidoreductase [Pedobacter yulinensis]